MSEPAPKKFTAIEWIVCALAAVGFAFDIYEILVMPLILQPLLKDLANIAPGTPEFRFWGPMVLVVPFIPGGIFGMLGGYLTDLYGRRRVLVFSILLYAASAVAAGYATNIYWLIFFRCTTLIGVCVEFVAAVAWLAELFPNPQQREKVLGYTQAFSSFGGMMVAGMYGLIVANSGNLPAINGGHADWRYLLMSGVLPALPLIVLRPFMPDSPVWKAKKEAGTLRRPSFAAIFAPRFRRTTIVTTIIFACGYAAAFGAIQQLPQIVRALPEVKAYTPTEDALKAIPAADQPKAKKEAAQKTEQTAKTVQLFQEIGGLVGRFALAVLALSIASRGNLLRIFQLPGLVLIFLVFWFPASNNLEQLKWGAALVGFCTVAQFSFWGNYLPLMYPVHLRGTGESFAANIGGRVLGTSAFFITQQLTAAPMPLYKAAAIVGASVYVIGLVSSFFLPEPDPEMAHE